MLGDFTVENAQNVMFCRQLHLYVTYVQKDFRFEL